MRAGHRAVQHVLIEDLALADFLGLVLSGVPAINREQRLWQRTGAEFRNLWHEALHALQCADLHWQPAGLRGGGATKHFLHHRDVQGQRRRGSWTQLATVDRYTRRCAATHTAHRGSQAPPAPGSPGGCLLPAPAKPVSTTTRHLQQEVVERGSSLTGRTATRCRGSAHVYWPSSFAGKEDCLLCV